MDGFTANLIVCTKMVLRYFWPTLYTECSMIAFRVALVPGVAGPVPVVAALANVVLEKKKKIPF